MDQDARVMADALRDWDRLHSPQALVREVLPIIRGPESIDWILSQIPTKARARVVRELQTEYGPHVYVGDESEWGMAAGAYTDPEAHQRRHAAYVAHAVRVAIPAIRAWLAAHPDEPGG